MSCLKSGGSVAKITYFLSLARRFSASKCEKWKKSRTKRSFWKLVAKFGRSLWEVLLAFRGVAESREAESRVARVAQRE